MALSQQFLEQLLHEDEGTTLDFKREQYLFEGADDDEKSELLKDILAFANARRRSDAYILIGVEEVKGGRSNVTGVTDHLDDAKLQQFVNAKTQRPLHFSYHQTKLDDHDIGVLHIPLQERPIYLTKDYGKLKKNEVHIRRGSSTAIASPDEIIEMGQPSADSPAGIPLLEIEFYDPNDKIALGTFIEVPTVNLEVPGERQIPDYEATCSLGGLGIMRNPSSNPDYYREFAAYLKRELETQRVEIQSNNVGNVLAGDVRVELVVDDPDGKLIIRDSDEMLDRPSTSVFGAFRRRPTDVDVKVERHNRSWLVIACLGKIQSKASARTGRGLFLGSKGPATVTIEAKIFDDNLPDPYQCNLTVEFKPTSEQLSLEKLLELSGRIESKDEGEQNR